MKQVEYVLLTALVGTMAAAFGGLVWPVLSQLTAVFMQIAQALQVTP